MIKHGECRTKLNKVWRNMKDRCFNPNNKRFPHYGGRGIDVCQEWKDNYVSFRNWAISNGYKIGLSLDRIDNNGNYCPQNCRWVDSIIQNNNFSRNRFVTYNGVTLSISQWSKITKIHRNTLDYRLKRGWEVGKALNYPDIIQMGDAFQLRNLDWALKI